LELGFFRRPAHNHRATALECLSALAGSDLGFSAANGDDRLAGSRDFNSVVAVLERTHGDVRGFDVDIGFPALQLAISHDPVSDLDPELAVA